MLILPDVDYFWDAEGHFFSCQFIVHVAGGVRGSQLTLIQAHPIIYHCKRFELIGRTGPGRYMDLRPSMQSPQAAAELQAFLAARLPGAIAPCLLDSAATEGGARLNRGSLRLPNGCYRFRSHSKTGDQRDPTCKIFSKRAAATRAPASANSTPPALRPKIREAAKVDRDVQNE